VIVQDASNSLHEKRLEHCRRGIVNSLRYIAPADRFNIALFREETTFCFEKWANPTPENIAKATAFVEAIRSRGDTDIFESLKKLMTLPRDSRRPLVVIVITDGKATHGMTSSTDIIGEFSRLNDNMSLFVVGTKPTANDYLLNMLSFCNRGAQTIVKDNYGLDKSIPLAIESMVARCSYPVLGRIGVTAGMAAGADFYPYPPPNLYAGRKLTFYGSCPSNVKEIVMQVRGEGGGAKCDCLFTVDLEHAASGGGDIRTTWADRKMHDLIGRYARERTPAARKAIFDFAAATGMPVPFRGSF
jgi:Ca-activated chloride channel family protein